MTFHVAGLLAATLALAAGSAQAQDRMLSKVYGRTETSRFLKQPA